MKVRGDYGGVDPNPTTDEWRVVDSYSTGGGVSDAWRALGPWRATEAEALGDARLASELADTKALLARGVELVEEDTHARFLLKGLAVRMRECTPMRSQDSGYVIPQFLVEMWADEIEALVTEPAAHEQTGTGGTFRGTSPAEGGEK